MAVPELHIDVEAVGSHATMVDNIADMLAEVAAATSYLDQHDEVYGEWPSVLILPFLNMAQDHAVQEMRTGTDATAHLADLLRALTVNISLTDSEAAQILSFREPGR
ncbi:type VII secretion target [Actinoplanes sp. NEAU-A12]|uniref:Type VII secretion target n=1 Tax=Actinoplanes sandaracinus TaxID=3045177 RepID=A0ABT6WMJ4_9ACTN|nr:type VII secretion target [Actinoplanes sandaracinus]MDI6100957.1 type VII secretion target [Actinoplanes sandaracinus]